MSDTQTLLGKISALRQRLEQAQSLAQEAGSTAVGLFGDGASAPVGRLRALEEKVAVGLEHNDALENTLHDLDGGRRAADHDHRLPVYLTSRARRLLEKGHELLLRIRELGEQANSQTRAEDPLPRYHRETTALLDAALRVVQAFPDTAGGQLRLCDGLEQMLATVAHRGGVLNLTLTRRRAEADRIATLTELLVDLFHGRGLDIKPFVVLAEQILSEAHESMPLRFLHGDPETPAHFVACHSLTVAHVMARLVRYDGELRSRPVEPVLAALIHDVGMLSVPVELLRHPGPLDDEQRRIIEAHVRVGASLAARLLPSGNWLAEACGGHHERLDGTGYLDGQREYQIAPLTRLLAVCDTYAALCCPRPYRPARETRTALADTLLLAEQGLLDRHMAERLLHLSFYPVGSVVELADGAIGVVIAAHGDWRDLATPSRPVVNLLTDPQGRFLATPQTLDLAVCDGRSIVRSLTAEERYALLARRHPELL